MLWVEVSNRGLGWVEGDAARRDLKECAGAGDLDPSALRAAREDLAVLRRVYADAVLRRRIDTPAASQWLAAVTLHAALPAVYAGFELPALRARRSNAKLPAKLDEILSTALVELFAARDLATVKRCRGLLRATPDVAPAFDPRDEAEFAAQAELDGFVQRGWVQCARLVHAPRLGQYCGKACSNAAFAARKGARDPRYFAAKQANYRDRQRRRESRAVVSGAFSFVD